MVEREWDFAMGTGGSMFEKKRKGLRGRIRKGRRQAKRREQRFQQDFRFQIIEIIEIIEISNHNCLLGSSNLRDASHTVHAAMAVSVRIERLPSDPVLLPAVARNPPEKKCHKSANRFSLVDDGGVKEESTTNSRRISPPTWSRNQGNKKSTNSRAAAS